MKRTTTLKAAAIAGTPATAVAQGGAGYDHMMGWGTGMLWGPVFWLFCVGLVIIAVVVVLRLFGGRDSRPDTQDNEASRILKNRYAQGEIDKEQYDQMRRDLER